MKNPNIPFKDAVRAEVFSLGSRAFKKVPLIDRLMVGKNTIPAGWFRYGSGASEMGPWAKVVGNHAGTRWPIPPLYEMAGILAVDKSEFNELETYYHDRVPRQAVGVALGEAVIIGLLADDNQFSESAQYPGKKLAAMGLGYGDLIATMGLWLPDQQRLRIPDSVHSVDRLMKAEVPPEISGV